jgi:LPXTG-site transpeptidase (sortase) family protein
MITRIAQTLLFWTFLFLAIGTSVLGLSLVYSRYWKGNLSFNKTTVTSRPATLVSNPIHLTIKRLGINLPIETQEISATIWPETDRGVTFVKGSATPGSIGNSIFYGHNWTSLLGRLPGARIGDEVTITMDNGIVKTFVITKTKIVSPNDTEVLDDTNFSRLTLYTCTGFLDSKRFVAFAQPKI